MNTALAIVASLGLAAAYPAAVFDFAKSHPSSLSRAQDVMQEASFSGDDFNASAQFIKTTGIYSFMTPTKNDLRGPCPGLNALANHGYIPRNGYTTVHELTEAVMKVYGMGSDLALFLATYGAVIEGDLTTVSIGGRPSLSSTAPAAGQVILGSGLSHSHNHFETAGSPTFPDVGLIASKLGAPATDATRLSTSRAENFEQLFAMQPDPEVANYDITVLARFRSQRFHHSISHNPSFFVGPFTGVIMQSKAYSFIYRLMANHSTERPEGIVNQNTLKSFFAMTGPNKDGKFVHQPGHERIPEGWYRRDVRNPYDNAFFLTDVAAQARRSPEFLQVGGNVNGRTRSFKEIDLNKLTGGTYGTEDRGSYDFACLAYQSALHGARRIIAKRYADEFDATTTAIDALRNALVPILDTLQCPRLNQIDEQLFETFEGYTKGGWIY